MDAKFSTYLSGFNGFGRSFNRSVLAHDIRLHQEYKDALNNGSLPCNRLRVLTIGDKGVGKTSTLQHLQGQVCDPSAEPQATEGIEITICETCDREPSWKRCSDGSCKAADDPGLCAAWCVCAGVDSMGGILHRGKEDSASTDGHGSPQQLLHSHGFKQRARTAKRGTPERLSTREAFQRFNKILLLLFYQVKIASPAVVLFVLFSIVLNNFGVLCWLAIFLSVPLFKSDFNSSYRFITSAALQIISIDVAITAIEYVANLGDTHQKEGSLWVVIVAVVLYLGVCAMSTVLGLLCGLGCRSGVAVAFCLMTHKSMFHMNATAVVAVVIGNLFGLLLLRDGFKCIQKIAKCQKLGSASLVALVSFLLASNYQPLVRYFEYVSHVLVGILMGFGYPYGVLKGREIITVRKLMLPYLLKKSFGFVIAFAIGQLMGWRMLVLSETSTWVSIICSLLAACGFPVYDWMVAQQVKRLEKDGIPITTFRKYLMDAATQDNPVGLKLHFWDNAGDSVYQTMQQFFRPAEAVYLLVFSLEAARENEVGQLQHLSHWLFTVKAHSKNPNTVVFIVGTHRDSVTEEFITSFAALVNDQLYKDFCSILAINGDRGPLYVIENSKPVDEDGLNLRQSIINVAKTTPFMNEPFPIRHLSVLNKIQDMQSDGHLPWILTTSHLLQEIAEEDMNLEDLLKILVSLHRTGDVIYQEDDNILKEYVIIKPQNLLDVLKAIVHIPPKASRALTDADDWLALEMQGIAFLKLIKAVVGSETILPCVMRLMEAYNLLIPIHSNHLSSHQPSQNQEEDPSSSLQPEVQATLESASSNLELPIYYVLPSHLPEFTGDDADFWEPSPEDEEYFFDFGFVVPDSIFHRLLAKCWCHRDINERVFKTRGRFRYQGANFYTIQLQKVSISQNTIQVIILHDGQNRCSLQILHFLHRLLEEIRRRDFPNLPYSCGPACRSCSSNNFLRVLKVCGNDKDFPTANMPFEAFMPQGRYHEVHLTPQLKVTCGRRRASSSDSSIGSHAENRTCEDAPLMNQISVGETSNRVMVITGGNNSKFDIYGANLPGEGETHNT